jgi:hypothetical protein
MQMPSMPVQQMNYPKKAEAFSKPDRRSLLSLSCPNSMDILAIWGLISLQKF